MTGLALHLDLPNLPLMSRMVISSHGFGTCWDSPRRPTTFLTWQSKTDVSATNARA